MILTLMLATVAFMIAAAIVIYDSRPGRFSHPPPGLLDRGQAEAIEETAHWRTSVALVVLAWMPLLIVLSSVIGFATRNLND